MSSLPEIPTMVEVSPLQVTHLLVPRKELSGHTGNNDKMADHYMAVASGAAKEE
jgi:hypothetical protein